MSISAHDIMTPLASKANEGVFPMSRRWFGFVILFAVIVVPSFGQTPESQSLANMKRDLYFLASDDCEGRGPGTKGIDLAADYIAKQFADAGLKPGGVNGYFQPFTIQGPAVLETPNSIAVTGPDKKAVNLGDNDYHVMGISGSGKVSAPLVFVGYGLQTKVKYDEYVGIDVKGKIVVMLRRTPRWGSDNSPFGGKKGNFYGGLEKKVAVAQTNGAAAVILINDASEAGDVLPPFSLLAAGTSNKIPCIQVKRSVIDPILKSGLGMSLPEIEKAIDRDLKPLSGPLNGWTAKVETHVARSRIPVKNVIAVLDGKGPLANEILVVGAHYDHLGYGGSGSLAGGVNAIHHGADDNGSGTTAVMELARRYAEKKDRQGRKLVFMAFSAEERGLLGSQHYCKEPLFPLADTAAMVNIDMVGKLRPDMETKKDKLIVQGIDTSKNFGALVEKLNTPGFTFAKTKGGNGPSDHSSFYDKKIPVLFFWTGTHPDYHKPSDTAERINYEGMKKIVDYVDTVVAELATVKDRPQYIAVKGGAATGAPAGAKLGVRPNYESDKEGLLLDGVNPGEAAEKAGLKAGDRIVEIAGKTVTNIETYMVIMSQQKVGQAIEIGILRDGKKMTLKATPQ
jgi:hypothetical protein